MVAFDSTASGFALWTLTQPGIAQDGVLANALGFLSFGFGGPGFAMPMGLLIAGVSLTGGLSRLLPRWLMWFGLALAAAGELSWLALMLPGALFLIPLTRFPAFVWLLLTAWLLPNRAAAREAEMTR